MSDTEQTIKILAIESSCDETAAAVVVNGRDMRSNVISSQIAARLNGIGDGLVNSDLYSLIITSWTIAITTVGKIESDKADVVKI